MSPFQLAYLNKMLVVSNLHEKIFTLYHGVRFYFFFLTLPFFFYLVYLWCLDGTAHETERGNLKGEVYTPWQLLGGKYELCWAVSSENKLMSILLLIKLEKKIRYILDDLYNHSELKMVEETVASFNRPTSIYQGIHPLLYHWPHLLAFPVIVWSGNQLKIKIFIP